MNQEALRISEAALYLKPISFQVRKNRPCPALNRLEMFLLFGKNTITGTSMTTYNVCPSVRRTISRCGLLSLKVHKLQNDESVTRMGLGTVTASLQANDQGSQ